MAVDASALISLDAAQAALRGRLRWLRLWVRALLFVRLAILGVAVASIAMVLIYGAGRLYGITHSAQDVLMPLALACAAALFAALIWPLSDRLMAMSADRRAGLWDRMATAIELSAGDRPSGMERAQVMDAVRMLSAIRPLQAWPLRFDRAAKVAAGGLVALLAVQLGPIPPLLLSRQEREERAELREIARELEPAARELEEEAEETDDEEIEQVSRELRRLTQQLRRGKLDKRQALLELDDMQERLQKLEQRIRQPSLKTARETARKIGQRGRQELARKARELAERASKRGERELERRMRELAEQAREAKSAEQMRKIGAEMQTAAEQMGAALSPSALLDALSVALEAEDWAAALEGLEALQGMLAGGDRQLTEEEARELAQRLAELAEKLSDTELAELAECLKKAGECMKAGDCKGAAACLGRFGELKAVEFREALKRAGKCCGGCCAGLRGTCSGRAGMGIGPDRGSRQSIPPGTPGASLYAPREADVDASPEAVRSHVRPGGEAYTSPVPVRGAPDEVAPSRVPYYEVIGDYSRAAEDALEREEVPPAYRATVRQYFQSLQSAEPAPDDSAAEERDDG
ncbi:MAG: hypothetical protein U9R79_11045 [Armatimonadota bacterium]|nr:hypothetical protein [Armatimonadota bacterium]